MRNQQIMWVEYGYCRYAAVGREHSQTFLDIPVMRRLRIFGSFKLPSNRNHHQHRWFQCSKLFDVRRASNKLHKELTSEMSTYGTCNLVDFPWNWGMGWKLVKITLQSGHIWWSRCHWWDIQIIIKGERRWTMLNWHASKSFLLSPLRTTQCLLHQGAYPIQRWRAVLLKEIRQLFFHGLGICEFLHPGFHIALPLHAFFVRHAPRRHQVAFGSWDFLDSSLGATPTLKFHEIWWY